jgi:hypothetical protein
MAGPACKARVSESGEITFLETIPEPTLNSESYLSGLIIG